MKYCIFLLSLITAITTARAQQTLYEIYDIWIGNGMDELISGDSARLDFVTNYDGDGQGFTLRLVIDEPSFVNPDVVDTVYAYSFVQTNDTLYSAYFKLPDNTRPGNGYIEFYTPGLTELGYSDRAIRVVSKPIITHDLFDTLLCGGETFFYGVSVLCTDWPTIEWFHDDLLMEEWTDTGIYVHEADYADTGTYFCVLTNSWGVDTSNFGRISFPALGFDLGKPSGTDHMCQSQDTSIYAIPGDPHITLYSWTLLPPDAGDLVYKDTSATISWDKQFSGKAKLLVKTKIDNCRGPNSDTLDIIIAGPGERPDICIVGVDPATDKNMVVWEKPAGSAIQAYIIHRETNQAGTYLPLDTIDAAEFSIYVDSTSTPELVSQRYKLSLIDTCGFESELSTYHKTIHLTNNMAADGKVNLIWDGYEGFAFLSYNLFHGTHPDSMEYINTVPSNVFIYSNIVPFPGDNFFQIEAIHPEGCTPSLKSINYGSSRSNILYVENEEVIEGIPEKTDSEITLFPSPAGEEVTIVISNFRNHVRARLVNVSGQLVQEFIIDSGSYELDISSLQEGLYILHIIQGNNSLKTKIIKSR